LTVWAKMGAEQFTIATSANTNTSFIFLIEILPD
jgi:hypothetical protein